MAKAPLITFKAGFCDFDISSHPPKVKPKLTPGYLYLFEEDDLVHFCWRPRAVSLTQPELDLTMVPGDGTFIPYKYSNSGSTRSPTNGRVFVLKFQSSTQRYFFWLQSKSQHPQGDSTWFSPRDLKLGQIIDRLLQGDSVNVAEEVATLNHNQGGNGDDDHGSSSHMEGLRSETGDGTSEHTPAPEPFTDDTRNESRGSGKGGTDEGRSEAISANEATAAVQNFLKSMQGTKALEDRFPQIPKGAIITLLDLLPPSTTVPIIDAADESFLDKLLSQLPLELLNLSRQSNGVLISEVSSGMVEAGAGVSNFDQKQVILKRVLRSPQFSQSLVSLTGALRDGGLPAVSDALRIPVENGGYTQTGGLAMGGNDAIGAFVGGIKTEVENYFTNKSQENT